MEQSRRSLITPAQWTLAALIVAITVGSVLYRLIVWKRLEQTSLLFIGIPSIIAIILALTPKTRTVKGGIFRGITIALLMSGPLLGEGFICILMSAPIFYFVGLLIGFLIDAARARRRITLSCLVLVLLPLSFEGSSPRLSFDRNETVRSEAIVNSTPTEVELALSRSPRTDLPLPRYLRMGFPRPTEANGTGLELGASRKIHFAGGEGHPGDLVLRVTESRPGCVRFEVVSDSSKIAHWLDWKSSEVSWAAIDGTHTRVIWTIKFQRRLDPAWYFRPWERYATRLAADYLIRANATPANPGRGE